MNPVILAVMVLFTDNHRHVAWRTKQSLMWIKSLRGWGGFTGDVVLHVNDIDNPLWDPVRELATLRDIAPWYDDQYIQTHAPDPAAFNAVGNIHMMKLITAKAFVEENPGYDVILTTDVDVIAVRSIEPMLRVVTAKKPIFLATGNKGIPIGNWCGSNGYLDDEEVVWSVERGTRELCSAFIMGTPEKIIEVTSSAIETVNTRRYRTNRGLEDHFEQAAVNLWAFQHHDEFSYMDRWVVQGMSRPWMRPHPDTCLVHFFARNKDKMELYVANWKAMH